MKSDRHYSLFEGSNPAIAVKGLRSKSIQEQPVPVLVDRHSLGRFHGVELYQNLKGGNSFPQTVADLVSNGYFRLSPQKDDGTSATFGSSVIGTCSFRSADGVLQLIPQVSDAAVAIGAGVLEVSLSASYGELARFQSLRQYRCDSAVGVTSMCFKVSFTALRDICLAKEALRNDAFRLFSLSSMYSSVTCYDGNVLCFAAGGASRQFDIKELQGRRKYLFPEAIACDQFELLKKPGSLALRGYPGAFDSPSIAVRVIDASMPVDELGIQGYLSDSVCFNEDSLSVWSEWINCPARICEGETFWAKIEVEARAGHEETPIE